MKYRKIAADLIRRGENVALYCDGVYSDTNILYLDKFLHVRPAVVIDNDPKKKGKTLFSIPIMPYAEAKAAFPDLHYYIQGNTYQYAIIGALLEDGVPPERIVNYVPVEKRDGCLIAESSIGIANDACNICYETGFNYNKNNRTLPFQSPLTVPAFDSAFSAFRDGEAFAQSNGADCRSHCPMFQSGYYAADPKIRLIGDYNSDYCSLACVYCFLQELGMSKGKRNIQFHDWLSVLLQSRFAGDALILHLCPTEKLIDEDIDRTLEICDENADSFEAIHLFSCCYAYRKGLEPLLEKGMAKSYWSLDAGTEETFEKIKRKKNAFGKVLENVSRYQSCDAFGGQSIVPKYSIVRGLNDNERDFDGFIELCLRFHVRYCAIQWDYADNDNTDEGAFEMIRSFYRKIQSAGLRTTYTSGSTVLSKALNSLAFYENGQQ